MSTEIVTDLVHEKDALVQAVRTWQAAAGALALAHGQKKENGTVEYRIPKAQLNKLTHQISLQVDKAGGVKIVLVKAD